MKKSICMFLFVLLSMSIAHAELNFDKQEYDYDVYVEINDAKAFILDKVKLVGLETIGDVSFLKVRRQDIGDDNEFLIQMDAVKLIAPDNYTPKSVQ